MARPGYSRVGGALVMAASSVLGYLGQARLEDVPFWSVVYALVTIYIVGTACSPCFCFPALKVLMSQRMCLHACMEFFELAVQSSSLLSRATETDALIVCINEVVLAMNLMLLPLTLQVASSGTSIFLAMLLLEIELDKVYVLLSLVSTLPLDIMSHLGFIVPLIMISSTVQGFQKVAEQNIGRNGWLHALTAVFVTSGCALFAYTMLSLFIQQGECVAIIGDVATCAYPRIYWSQGFLAPTNCTWETVETFECHDVTVMKDSQVYSEMLALQSINASGSMLTSIPRHVYRAAHV